MPPKLTRRSLFSFGRSKEPAPAATHQGFDLERFYAARAPSDSARVPVVEIRRPKEPIPTSQRGVPDLPGRKRRP